MLMAAVIIAAAGFSMQASGKTEPVISKEYNLNGFSGLQNDFAVTVHYSQGSTFRINAEGPKELIESMKMEVKDGVLRISKINKKKHKNVKHPLLLYITSPKMNSLENSGVLHFDTENWTADDFHLENSGVLRLNAEQLECKEGTCKLTGVSDVNMQVKAEAWDMKNKGVTKGKIALSCNQLDINSEGVDNMDFDFKGRKVKVRKSGTGTIKLDVDCERLEATNSGVGQLTISGTADDTSIENTGVTKIDVSKLNQF